MKKILIFIFMALMSLSVVSAYTNTSFFDYRSFDNNDLTNQGYGTTTITNDGATFNTDGIISNTADFDGTAGDMVIDNLMFQDNTISVGWWFKADDNNPLDFQYMIGGYDGATLGDSIRTWLDTSGQIGTYFRSDTNSVVSYTHTIDYADNSYHFIVYTWDSNNLRTYIDGSLIRTDAFTGGWSFTNDIGLGVYNDRGTKNYYFDGRIDEFFVYDNVLNSTDIIELYGGGSGLNPFTPPSTTPQITANVQNYYNSENISLNLSAVTNVNMSYVLDGGVETAICNDCNNATLNLNSLSEINHTLILIANDIYGEQNNTYNFVVDITKPTISIIGNLTQSFEVDFSTIFNVTDNLSGLDTCTIDITYLENITNPTQYDALVNCDAIHTFTANGLYNGLVTATDNAGNVETLSLNGTISTFVELNFLDRNNNSISSYDLVVNKPNGVTESFTNLNNPYELYPYFNDELILGNYNLEFSKLGYLTTEINLTVTETSGEEVLNYNILGSTIVLKIYDGTTNNLITSPTEITLINTAYVNTTTTGEVNITEINFYDGEYQIILTNDYYQTENLYFNFNNREVLNVNAYMLPTNLTNLGVLNVKVEDSINVISNQLVNLQAWDSTQSAYITVGQGKSNSNGDVFFNVELGDTMYKVVGTRDGNLVESPEQIITVSGTVIYLIFSNEFLQDVTYDGQDIVGSVTNTTYNATHDTVTFTFSDANNLVTKACLEINQLRGSYSTQLSENCIYTPSGTIEVITSNNNSFVKEVLGVAYIDDRLIKVDNLIYQSNTSLEIGLDDLAKWIILALMIGTIALGVVLGNVNIIGIGSIVMSWTLYAIFPLTLSYTIPLLITIIVLLILYGTFKKRF